MITIENIIDPEIGSILARDTTLINFEVGSGCMNNLANQINIVMVNSQRYMRFNL